MCRDGVTSRGDGSGAARFAAIRFALKLYVLIFNKKKRNCDFMPEAQKRNVFVVSGHGQWH